MRIPDNNVGRFFIGRCPRIFQNRDYLALTVAAIIHYTAVMPVVQVHFGNEFFAFGYIPVEDRDCFPVHPFFLIFIEYLESGPDS